MVMGWPPTPELHVSLCAGVKVIITGWAMDPTTMLEDRGRCRGCRGRRSLPLPPAPCTVCAARRMVGGRPLNLRTCSGSCTQLWGGRGSYLCPESVSSAPGVNTYECVTFHGCTEELREQARDCRP